MLEDVAASLADPADADGQAAHCLESVARLDADSYRRTPRAGGRRRRAGPERSGASPTFLASLGGIGAPRSPGSEKLAKAMAAEAVPETPIAVQVPMAIERDSSIMAYLKSDEIVNVVAPPPAPRPAVKHEMRSPLTSSFELSRLVQAVAPPPVKKSGLSSRTIMFIVGAPLVLVVAGVSALALGGLASSKTVSAAEPAPKAAEPAVKA